MLQTLNSLLAPAVMERLTLVINHVLGAEDVATERLKAHAGRTLELAPGGWPSLLPPPPPCVFRVTPAGLLEWCGLERGGAADLVVRVDASNPARLLASVLAGDVPSVAVEGEAVLAGDVNWLMQNLRWDVAADLERLFGPAVAQQLHRLGSAVAHAIRAAVQGAGQVRDRLRPRS
jgi:ubiquinone biosynthesis accessory factor UbiJ